MKICMVAPIPPPYGGIANWTVLMDEYVQGVDDIEFVHLNIAPKKRGLDGRTLWDRVVVQGFSMFKQRTQLCRIIKEEKVDVIHMTTSGQLAVIRDILLLKAAKKRGVPAVYHIHFGRIPEIAKANTREWKLIKRAMQLSDAVIAIDTTTLNAIKQYAPEVNACYVPNPFDLQKIEKAGYVSDEPTRKEIVFIGWVIKTKGVEELLESWQTVCASYPDWKLRIIGPYAEEYYSELKKHFFTQNVIFDGEQKHDDAMKLLAGAEAFILPSYTEGFPNAVLEAMALGKPIIATDVGAIPDMLEGCGIVIPSRNVQAISEAIERLLQDEDLRSELSTKAMKKMKEEYTIEKVFEVYRRHWSDVCI